MIKEREDPHMTAVPKKPPSAIERKLYAIAFDAIKEKLQALLKGQPLVVIGLVVASLDAILLKGVPWPPAVTKVMAGIVSLAGALELWRRVTPVELPAKK
jgi:hypothetical protein